METTKFINSKYDLKISDNVFLAIHVKEAKKSILGVILFFALSIFFIPILYFIYLVTMGGGISFGFIISCVVGLLSSGYLFRLYLWNKYGKEVFIIQSNHFISYYDYKYFRDSAKSINFKSIIIYYQDNKIWNNAYYKVLIPEKESNIESVICLNLDGKEVISEGEILVKDIIKVSKFVTSE